MRKKILSVIIISVIVCLIMTACSKSKETDTKVVPELSNIQSICEMATQECYYHTVAKIEKGKTVDHEIFDFLKKARTVWIEYAAIAKIGIDMTKVELKVKENSVEIHIPEAELFSLEVDPNSYNKDSIYVSEDDWLVPNPVTADLVSKAVGLGQEETEKEILANKSLMKNAQIRAQQLIKNYIDGVGKAAEITYNITWVYDDGTKSEETPELEKEE